MHVKIIIPELRAHLLCLHPLAKEGKPFLDALVKSESVEIYIAIVYYQ